jgi:ornithine cyclodeaminase
MGAYTPDMREADDDVLKRAGRLFVDTRNNSEGSGDVVGPLAAGIIDRSDIVADLFDLCKGRHHGRGSDDEITVYKNVGGGHLDMFAARHLVAQADAVG